MRILLCSDLDRTLLPNGGQPESERARARLRQLAARPEVTLAYVSGRDRRLLTDAIEAFALPRPDFAVGDVGTTIYRLAGDDWSPLHAWEQAIAGDWAGLESSGVAAALGSLDGLRLQEPEKQNRYKLSYYGPGDADPAPLEATIHARLAPRGIAASVIWSVDETRHEGLLDILPAAASKLHAIRFLMRHTGFTPEQTVFAGDSGNDLPVLNSGLQSVLVANATAGVRAAIADEGTPRPRVYIAKGGFMGMNGNYSAGVLEGVAHYFPQIREWLD